MNGYLNELLKNINNVSLNIFTIMMTVIFYIFMALLGKATITGWAHDADNYRRDR